MTDLRAIQRIHRRQNTYNALFSCSNTIDQWLSARRGASHSLQKTFGNVWRYFYLFQLCAYMQARVGLGRICCNWNLMGGGILTVQYTAHRIHWSRTLTMPKRKNTALGLERWL